MSREEPQPTRTEATPDAPRVAALMPAIVADLVRLAEVPSISFPGFPREPVIAAHDMVVDLLKGAGVEEPRTLELPDTAPVITGEIPAPEGAPTVLLYAHYDVQPPGEEALWRTPPFAPTERDGAIYGRGIADDKANVLMHVGALRAWEGRPPVGIKVVFEGQEEVGSALDDYPARDPEPFRADALVIGDTGNVRPGEPTFNVSTRGDAEVLVEVRTLATPKHSGDFGGAAPDALILLLHALATLHDAHGDVAVAGLRREPWRGESYDEDEFRRLAEVEPGMPLFGSGSLGERLWSGPAITVIGIDAPPVDTAVNAVVPYARAKLNLRVHPRQGAGEAQAALVAHLEAARPFGAELKVTPLGDVGDGFAARTDGIAYRAAAGAMADAWGREPVEFALGGAIPFVSALQRALPEAEILLFGAQDGECNLHAPNERVRLDELERAVLAEARFFARYADEWEAER